MSIIARLLGAFAALYRKQDHERSTDEPIISNAGDNGEAARSSPSTELELEGGDADRLGRNFAHLSYEFLPTSPFTPQSLDAAIDDTGPVDLLAEGEWEWDIEVIDSKAKLVESFAASASAYGTAWGVEVEGSAGFLSEIEIDKRTLLVVASARKEVDRRGFDVSRLVLRPELVELMKSDPATFYKSYGSYVATQVARGGWMTLVFRRTFSTFAERRAVEAKLRAAGLVGGGTAEARHQASKTLSEEGFTASAHGAGGDTHAPGELSPDAAFAWVTDTWMRSVNETTASVIGVRLAGLWLIEPPHPAYGEFLFAPSRITEEATQAKLDLIAIRERAEFAGEDPGWTQEQKKRLGAVAARADAASALLALAFEAVSSPLDRPAHADVLEAKQTPEALVVELDGILQEPRREPIKVGEHFLLRTTGENSHYVSGHDGKWVLTSPSRAQAAQVCFHTKGAGNRPHPGGAIWVGDRVRLAMRDGDGDRRIMRANGKNSWIQLVRGTDADRTWVITRKAGPAGEKTIYVGDTITLVNARHAGMTLKSRQKGGRWWLKALGFKSHWQKIESIG